MRELSSAATVVAQRQNLFFVRNQNILFVSVKGTNLISIVRMERNILSE